jgi:hypothetical protein
MVNGEIFGLFFLQQLFMIGSFRKANKVNGE